MLKRKLKTDRLFIGLALILSLLIMVMLVFVVKIGINNYQKQKVVTQSDTEFKKYFSHIDTLTLQSDLILFPKDNIWDMDIKKCYFSRQTGIFDTYYQAYMICEFDKEQFQDELYRIQHVCVKVDGKEQRPIYEESGFDLPAYISIYDDTNYEYVLVDQENNTIKYILNIIANPNNGVFPEDMLSGKFKPIIRNKKDGYNMYLFYDGKGFKRHTKNGYVLYSD